MTVDHPRRLSIKTKKNGKSDVGVEHPSSVSGNIDRIFGQIGQQERVIYHLVYMVYICESIEQMTL